MSGPPTQSPGPDPRLKRAARWAVLFVLVTGLAWYVATHLEDFEVVTQVGFGTIVLLVALAAGATAVSGIKYYAVFRTLGLDTGFGTWFRIFLTGRVLNTFFAQAGNAYRAVVLKSEHGFSLSDYVAAFAAFAVLDRGLAVFLSFALVLAVEPGLEIAGANVAVVLGATLLAGAVLLGVVELLVWRRRGAPPSIRVFARVHGIVSAVGRCLHDARTVAAVLGLGIVSFGLTVLQNLVGFSALGGEVNAARLALYSTVKSTGNIVMITPGNAGVSEAIYGLLGGGLEQVAAHAIIVSALLTATGVATVAAMGFFAGAFRWARELRDGPAPPAESA